MGTERSTYFGIYIEIPNENKSVDNWVKINPKTKKQFVKNLNFDPQTGEELVLVNNPKIENVKYSFDLDKIKLLGFNHDLLFNPAYHESERKLTIWAVNDGRFGRQIDTIANFDIKKFANLEDIIQKFKDEYQPILDLIEMDNYKYQIKIGVVNYAH